MKNQKTAKTEEKISSIDTINPNKFPIVGIGASAGGLTAFESFFSGMPTSPTPNMAFVIVQHLDPDHKSILTELIQRYTTLKVLEIENKMVIEPNCTYIIPPNCDIEIENGAINVLTPIQPRGQRQPINFFFSSLAKELKENAVGIILSGTGSDGMLGIQAIKSAGGMVMVQSPKSAAYDGMPQSAIATGLVDFELSPSQMAKKLISFMGHTFNQSQNEIEDLSIEKDHTLDKIFALLNKQVNHDFSKYKRKTIQRRIERRMAFHQIETYKGYYDFLNSNISEVGALFRELLIGVTNFFRDHEAFLLVEKEIIPKLFINKAPGEKVRVWCVGCSTGEEAYSVGMMMQEYLKANKKSFPIQIFASDIDHLAINTARAGVYPSSISKDVSPQRLAEFFTVEVKGISYRVKKEIREIVNFSEHDVTKDAPFSKIDLILCRNLLIYFDSDLQKKVIPLFHYALNRNGILFLGSSESVGVFEDLFLAIDRKLKIFQKKDIYKDFQKKEFFLKLFPNNKKESKDSSLGTPSTALKTTKKMTLKEFTEKAILDQTLISGILVNERGEILYLHGKTGMYLELAPGETAVNNILYMAREGLKIELLKSFKNVVSNKKPYQINHLRVKTNGHYTLVDMMIFALKAGQVIDTDEILYLITLIESPIVVAKDNPLVENGILVEPNPEIVEETSILKQELLEKESFLQATKEELELTNEELKSINEEMQSVNEEFQSTNEELETSKEELQSMNEELLTVNTELQSKIVDLSRMNNDMTNLISGTNIATLFVDANLRIIRYTPKMVSIVNLIPGDLGRPITHMASNFVNYERLVQDIRKVLETLIPIELEVQTSDKQYYILRMQPYRTIENVIEGVVLSFIDISSKKQIEKLRNQETKLLETTLKSISSGVIAVDKENNITTINTVAEQITEWSQAEALGKPLGQVLNVYADESQRVFEHLANTKMLISKSGIRKTIEEQVSPITNEEGETLGKVIVFSDFSEKKRKQEEILFLTFHDALTGVYNRRFYEEELNRLDTEDNLPLSIVIGDINGLKMMNDSFGHSMGDELLKLTAHTILKNCRKNDVLSRMGGDEFVILMPKTNTKKAEIIVSNILDSLATKTMNGFKVSVSFGIDTKTKADTNIQSVFKNAENQMYQQKTYEGSSAKNQSLGLILNTLFEKSQKESFHSKRVSDICVKIGEAMLFDHEKINQIKIAGLMHDVGKIGISENILNKTKKLSIHEYEEVKKHPEIGYRILSSASNFVQIAEIVFEHHERWDGTGYPRGLKGKEITLLARVINLADAYDAMTSNRSYKKPMSEEAAAQEIIRCSNKQFDPEIAKIFVEKVLSKPWINQ